MNFGQPRQHFPSSLRSSHLRLSRLNTFPQREEQELPFKSPEEELPRRNPRHLAEDYLLGKHPMWGVMQIHKCRSRLLVDREKFFQPHTPRLSEIFLLRASEAWTA